MLKHLLITAPDFVADAFAYILSMLPYSFESRVVAGILARYPRTEALYCELFGTIDFLELC